MSINSSRSSSEPSSEHSDLPTKFRQACRRVVPAATSLAVWLIFIALASGSVAAQSSVGDVYCGTGVETGIGIVFGAVAGLGLPATGFYVGRAGLSYMRAGGNPEKKNQAKEQLVMSGVGFGIIVLALISPELIDKVGSQMGFGFSDCVKPF